MGVCARCMGGSQSVSSRQLPAVRSWLGPIKGLTLVDCRGGAMGECKQGAAQGASIQVIGLVAVHVTILVDVHQGVCWLVDIAASCGWFPAVVWLVAECELLFFTCCLASTCDYKLLFGSYGRILLCSMQSCCDCSQCSCWGVSCTIVV